MQPYNKDTGEVLNQGFQDFRNQPTSNNSGPLSRSDFLNQNFFDATRDINWENFGGTNYSPGSFGQNGGGGTINGQDWHVSNQDWFRDQYGNSTVGEVLNAEYDSFPTADALYNAYSSGFLNSQNQGGPNGGGSGGPQTGGPNPPTPSDPYGPGGNNLGTRHLDVNRDFSQLSDQELAAMIRGGYLPFDSAVPGALRGHQSPNYQDLFNQFQSGVNRNVANVNITPDMLVEDRLRRMLSEDSAIAREANLKGAEYASGRGLQNSSIGAGAAFRELVNAATPIATQDARTTFEANVFNADAQNRMNLLESEMGYNAALASLGYANASDLLQMENTYRGALQMNEFNHRMGEIGMQSVASYLQTALQGNISLTDADLRGAYQLDGFDVQGEWNTLLTNLTNSNRSLLQTSASAATIYTSAIQEIGDVLSNNDISAADKDDHLTSILNTLQGGLNVLSQAVDIDYDFSSLPAISDG